MEEEKEEVKQKTENEIDCLPCYACVCACFCLVDDGDGNSNSNGDESRPF